MSGDCKEQPVIFYTEEMTETKIYLLQQYGIKFNMFNYSLCEKEEEE
jgi:hypothetical protein